jgi:crotonobetainyl-CoA:carnitine CoA-transferase CaiB-like acyl-CoA transferase
MGSLLWRHRSGKGQFIDLSLLDVQASSLANIGSSYLVGGKEAQRWGTAHESIVPYQVFPTKSHPIAIAAANQKLWVRFAKVVGREEWLEDPRFASNPDRVRHRHELLPLVAEAMMERTCEEWTEELVAADVPAGPVNNMERLFSDPQLLHRGMVAEVEHPTIEPLRLAGIPVKYSETPGTIRRAPPLLGQHTNEILSELLGYDADAIAQLKADGVT